MLSDKEKGLEARIVSLTVDESNLMKVTAKWIRSLRDTEENGGRVKARMATRTILRKRQIN